jgi:hypothetical protein
MVPMKFVGIGISSFKYRFFIIIIILFLQSSFAYIMFFLEYIYIQTNFRTEIKIIYKLEPKITTKYENEHKTETGKYSYNRKRTIFFVYKLEHKIR